MDKRGLELETLGKWIIGLAILVIIFLSILFFNNEGQSIAEFFKNFLRFGK